MRSSGWRFCGPAGVPDGSSRWHGRAGGGGGGGCVLIACGWFCVPAGGPAPSPGVAGFRGATSARPAPPQSGWSCGRHGRSAGRVRLAMVRRRVPCRSWSHAGKLKTTCYFGHGCGISVAGIRSAKCLESTTRGGRGPSQRATLRLFAQSARCVPRSTPPHRGSRRAATGTDVPPPADQRNRSLSKGPRARAAVPRRVPRSGDRRWRGRRCARHRDCRAPPSSAGAKPSAGWPADAGGVRWGPSSQARRRGWRSPRPDRRDRRRRGVRVRRRC